MDQVDFDPNQERTHHYNGGAYKDDDHNPRDGSDLLMGPMNNTHC